jgi:hypothetical protein
MNIIQYSAWAIDRAIEKAKITGNEVTADELVQDANVFATYMDAAIKKSDEMERTIEDEVEKRLQVELMKIKEGDNGLN